MIIAQGAFLEIIAQDKHMTTSTFGCRSFNEDKEILGQLLVQKVGGEHLATRPGGGAGNLTYVEGWKAIELANSLFGFEGWSCSVELLTPDFVETKENGRFSVGVTAVVRIVLKDGTFHEDVGFGQSEQRQKGMAIEFAKKEAVTDARKRALRFFGNALGNCIYDKEHLKSIKAGKVAVGALSYDGLRHGTAFIHKAKPPAFLSARTNPNPPNNTNNFNSTSSNNTFNNVSNNMPNNPPITNAPQNNPNPTSFTSKYSSDNNSNSNNNTNNMTTTSNNNANITKPQTTFSFSANYNSSNNNTNTNSNTTTANTNVNTSTNIRDNMMNNMMNNLNNSNNATFHPKTGVLSPSAPDVSPVTNAVSPNNPYLNSSRISQGASEPFNQTAFEDDSFDNDVFAQLTDQALQAYESGQNNTNAANNVSNSSPYSGSPQQKFNQQQQQQQQQQQPSPHTPSPSRSPYQSSSSSPYQQQQQQQFNASPYSSNPSPQQQDKEGTPPDKKRKFFVDVSA